MKQGKKIVRDPYHGWKIVNMMLAGVIILLVILALVDEKDGWLVPVTCFLGSLMCAFSGVMELTRGRKLVGYVSSVLAGALAVVLLLSIVLTWGRL